MSDVPPASPAPAPARPETERFFGRTLRVAAWSVALGIGLEIAQLVLYAFQGAMPDVARVVAETSGKIAWSSFVCVAISCGLAAGKARPQAMALLGMLSAPAGFAIARSVHKGVGSALSQAPGAAEAVSPFLLAAIKAVEYGVFGLIVARVSSGPTITLARHLLTGLGVGSVVAVIVCVLVARMQPSVTASALAGRAVSEILFPVGCAAVIYVTEKASRLARGVR